MLCVGGCIYDGSRDLGGVKRERDKAKDPTGDNMHPICTLDVYGLLK